MQRLSRSCLRAVLFDDEVDDEDEDEDGDDDVDSLRVIRAAFRPLEAGRRIQLDGVMGSRAWRDGLLVARSLTQCVSLGGRAADEEGVGDDEDEGAELAAVESLDVCGAPTESSEWLERQERGSCSERRHERFSRTLRDLGGKDDEEPGVAGADVPSRADAGPAQTVVRSAAESGAMNASPSGHEALSPSSGPQVQPRAQPHERTTVGRPAVENASTSASLAASRGSGALFP
eukprot:CAMPEP_0177681258 /NCGR_PEP_ID=MMETSP0447-20121125/30615_1 /TAXON_ID=0 /ORGANISM="Stygamoeba regulata, Strain BSH-02190019" /LENGTH=231 /DNA_ID=CAMNT_0019190653 /DNA_START=559 /DNA_END=1255 /DNA_ORIENTATION=-